MRYIQVEMVPYVHYILSESYVNLLTERYPIWEKVVIVIREHWEQEVVLFCDLLLFCKWVFNFG